MVKIKKRDNSITAYDKRKVANAIKKAFESSRELSDDIEFNEFIENLEERLSKIAKDDEPINVEWIQDIVEKWLMEYGYLKTAKEYILYREQRKNIRNWVDKKLKFIDHYKESDNTANATIDDNSNVGNKNIAIMNAEFHKTDNVNLSRGMITRKLKELYPDFDSKQYTKDLENHIIYKHDESTFSGAIAAYCCSITLYPFLLDGITKLGGSSSAPKNINSFCSIYTNMVHAVAGQFAGAVATSEFLLYFTYFAKKEWGDDFYKKPDTIISKNSLREITIEKQIEQYFQHVVYTLNQPIGARGMQSTFCNFSYFDKPFFEGMFGNFYFPDGTQPDWESLSWIQKKFMTWFNAERLKTILTFPVESFALVYKDGKFQDEESAKFVAEEYARGHSFFTYISDTVDSLSSCCRLKNNIQTKEFNFTNGNMGIQTGSKSVITLNLSRIIQNCYKNNFINFNNDGRGCDVTDTDFYEQLKTYITDILERVFKYHVAYNELLWDMYDANLLTVYKAGFINLNNQYLTIGLNGLNQAAEYLNIECTNNEIYKDFCKKIFGYITEFINSHNGSAFGHKIMLNCEMVPAESLAVKNYNWDKADGYWVPEDTNLYASYVFKPNDPNVSILDKITMHSKAFAAEELSGGQAAHLNLSEHLSYEQYWALLNYAGEVGCSYLTFNVPQSECDECGFITKVPIKECPKCHSQKISYYDRIIGYLTKIKNWSEGRQIEQKTRIYQKVED